MRFIGIDQLYGSENFHRIQASHIVVIGLGGVGSWTAECLARSGVEKITLVDLDEVCISNVNRQVHALDATIGKTKVAALSERLISINPDITIHGIEDFYTESSSQSIIHPNHKYDFVVDALDSLQAKALLISQCQQLGVSLITCGSMGGRKFPEFLKIMDLNFSFNDPFLYRLRKSLRTKFKFPEDKHLPYGIDCIFSTERMSAFNPSHIKGNCDNLFGSSCAVTACAGMFLASYVLNRLTNSHPNDRSQKS